MLGATVDQLTFKLIEMRDNHNIAVSPYPLIDEPKIVEAGSSKKRCCAFLYIKATKRIKYSSSKHPIIYNFLNGSYRR